jgi:outer membrane receptor protein involved in Fe transport
VKTLLFVTPGGSRGSSFKGLLVAALLLCAAAVGQAQQPATNAPTDLTEISLEELATLKVATVYGASRHEQKTADAPSSVSIVTSEDIKQYGYRTLLDLLRSVRGFYVSFNREYGFIGVRGFDRPGDFGGRVLVMVDGHRINDPLYDSNFAGTEFPLDIDLVDRVEIIRGPGSALYGNNAFFGVINVITRRGRDFNGGEASAAVASFDTFTGRLSYGKRFANGLELALSGSYLNAEGPERLYFPEFQSVNGGIAENLDGTDAHSIFASLSYGDFTLEGGYVDRDKSTPTAPYGTLFNSPGTRESDLRAFADIKYAHVFDDELEVLARLYFDHYRFSSFLPYAYAYQDPPPPGIRTINHDLDISRSYGAELQFTKTLLERNRITWGGEFRYDTPLKLYNADNNPPYTWVDINKDQYVLGLFLQDELTILTNLVLTAGVRYDRYSAFGDTINPRAALIYSPWPSSTFKFLYGQAYRAPNLAEWGYFGPGWTNNPSLAPETIESYEAIYERALDTHWSMTASLFLNQIHGLIDVTTIGINSAYANLSDAESRGFELGLEGRWAHGLRIGASYTFADAYYVGSDRPFSNSPQHLAKLNLAVPLWQEKLFAGLEVQGMSSRKTDAGNEIAGLVIANFTLFSREIVHGLEASLSIYNVFDRHYADPAPSGFTEDSLAQDGRTLRLKLTYRF